MKIIKMHFYHHFYHPLYTVRKYIFFTKLSTMSTIAWLVAAHNALLTSVGNAAQNCNQHFIEAVAVLEAAEGQTQEPMLAPPRQPIFDLDDENIWTDQNVREDFQ